VIEQNPDLTQYPTILVFGGSFDPPHWAHIELPRQVRRQIGADVIAYIPAAQSPHKLDRAPTPPADRLAMLRAALSEAEAEEAVILTDELDRAEAGEPSYTVDTLAALRERAAPGASLRLLIGADQVLSFDQWREPARIVELAEPVVMLRPPETAESLLANLAPSQREPWRDRLVEVTPMDVSATEVRRRVAAGEPISNLVPPAVARHIHERGLYRPSRS